MRLIFLFIFSIFSAGLEAQGDSTKTLDELIEYHLAATNTPGLVYALVNNNEISHGIYGVIRDGSDREMDTETLFLIGSISKSFTALALLTLVENGEVELEAPISKYLTFFINSAAANITIRQLLSHTSGYSTLQGNLAIGSLEDGKRTLLDCVEILAQWSPDFPPNEKWEYSNANYLILGAIIEVVSKMKFGDYIENTIFKPLGMNSSSVIDAEVSGEKAVGHQPWFGGKRPLQKPISNQSMAPTGGVFTSISDMGLYLRMMVNEQDDIISVESKKLMLQAASVTSPFYGMGWYVDVNSGRAFHTGLTPGIETLATLNPKEGTAVAVFVNSNSGMGFGVTTNLLYGVTAKLLNENYEESGNDWGTRSLYLTYALLPFLFLLGIISTLFKREKFYNHTGLVIILKLGFPVLIMLVMNWINLMLIPKLFGVTLTSFYSYQPDFVLLLIATSILGVFWALLRFGLFFR